MCIKWMSYLFIDVFIYLIKKLFTHTALLHCYWDIEGLIVPFKNVLTWVSVWEGLMFASGGKWNPGLTPSPVSKQHFAVSCIKLSTETSIISHTERNFCKSHLWAKTKLEEEKSDQTWDSISFPASLDSTIKEDQTAAPPLCKFQCGLRFLTAVLRRHLAGKEFILVYLFFVYVKLREYKSNGMSGTEINHASQN